MGSRIQRLFFNFNLKDSVKYITVNENFRVYIKELGWDIEIVIMAKRLEITVRGSGGYMKHQMHVKPFSQSL